MAEIESESQFMRKFYLHILMTPLTLILILFGKKKWGDLLQPVADYWKFLLQPKGTIILIGLSVLAYIASFFLDDKQFIALANRSSDILNGNFYTIITSGFLHANLMHLVGNVIALSVFGRVVERKLGFAKMMLIYFGALIISGVFNSLIHLVFLNQDIIGLGASGAIMGIVATAILLDPFYFTYEFFFPLPVMVMGWLYLAADLSGILNSTADGIGHFAHLGGFISIALLSYFLGVGDRDSMKRGLWINIVSFAVLVGVVFFFGR